MAHPWFTEVNINLDLQRKIENKVVESLKKYKGASTLKKEAMSILVKMLNSKEIEELRSLFIAIDKDKTGMITFEELQEALSLSNHPME